MKNKKTILYSIIILLVLIISVWIIYNANEKIIENSSLKNKIETLVEAKNGNDNTVIIDFKEITNFNWDKLYILTPYTYPKDYAKQQNIEGMNLINTDIQTNDSENLLVFVLKQKVVSYIHYPRRKGDFYNPEKQKLEGYTPKEAVFEVKENEDNWLEMINIEN